VVFWSIAKAQIALFETEFFGEVGYVASLRAHAIITVQGKSCPFDMHMDVMRTFGVELFRGFQEQKKI